MLLMYECNKCDYSTNRIYNFTKHNKSKKHIEKSKTYDNNTFNCDSCDKFFAYKSGLSRHKKNCSIGNSQTNKHILELKTQMLEMKIEHMQEKIELLTGYKNIAENTAESSKSSCSALNYIIKHYNDAPCIQQFTNFDLLTQENEEHTIAEIAIHKYNQNQLCTYIGDIIVAQYKTDDPKQQVLWISDINRLTYLIREVTANNKVEWFTDKGGVKLSKYIVKPILDHIHDDLIRFYDEKLEDLDRDICESDKKNIRNNLMSSRSIMKIIETNQLNDDIIKYIAKYVHLDRKDEIKTIKYDEID